MNCFERFVSNCRNPIWQRQRELTREMKGDLGKHEALK